VSRVKQALRSKTAGNSAWALGDQATSFVSTAVSAYLLTSRLGTTGYGAFAATYNLMGPPLAFIQSGVMLSVLDRIIRERKDPQQIARAYLGYVWTVGTTLAILLSLYVARFVKGMPPLAGALFIGTEFIVMAGMWVTTATMQAARGYRYAARVRIIVTAVRTTLMLTLALFGKFNLTWFPATQAAVFVVLAFLLHRWQETVYGARFRPSRFTKSDVAASSVYAVGLSAIGVQDSYDQVVLQSHYRDDAGRYAAAYRIVSLGMMPLSAIANATHMDFLDVNESSNDQIHKARKFALLGIAYSAVFCLGVIIAAPLVPKVLGHKYDGSVTMMRLLVPLVPLRGIGTFPMNGLLGLGRNKLRTNLLLGSAAFSLTLYLVLIPHWSWKGAVVGTVISESVLFAAAWIALFRCQAAHNRNRITADVG